MRCLCFSLIGLLLLLTFPHVLDAQVKYTDYSNDEKEIILNEEFNSLDNGWSKHSKVNIHEGKLIVNTSKYLGSTPHASLNFNLDQSRDFEIEILISFNKWASFLIFFNRIVWDFSIGNKSQTWICEATSDIDRALTKGIFDFKELIQNSKIVLKPSIPHKLTIRKIGINLIFYINEIQFGKTNVIIMQQPVIAFQNKYQGGDWPLIVESVKISYLNKDINQSVKSVRNNTEIKGIDIKSIKEGGKYYSLIIGVSDYNDPKMKLDHPANDALKLKDILLNRYTFNDSTTFLVVNPTRQKLIAELFRLRKIIGPNDNLLIFYAGHGHWDEDAKQGYWWPKDATTEDPSNWLSNSDLREQIRSIKSAHTLLISDACFSGGIFKSRSGAEIMNASKDIQLLYKMPSRRAMTSGTMTTVPDKSVFLEYLCKRLSENQEKFMSSQNLFDSFRAAVINNSNVVPQDGVIAETGDEGGDFIFILKNK